MRYRRMLVRPSLLTHRLTHYTKYQKSTTRTIQGVRVVASLAPNSTMTRVMFAVVLYRVAGAPQVTGENPNKVFIVLFILLYISPSSGEGGRVRHAQLGNDL